MISKVIHKNKDDIFGIEQNKTKQKQNKNKNHHVISTVFVN